MENLISHSYSFKKVIQIHELKTEGIGIDDPSQVSPKFILDFADSVKGGLELDSDQEDGEVEIEEHEPLINDGMSGALHPSQDKRISQNRPPGQIYNLFENSSTVCWNSLEHLVEYMPHLLLTEKTLPDYDIFKDHRSAVLLSDGYHTTIKGLCRAWLEVTSEGTQNGSYEDEDLLDALRKRSGFVLPDEDGYEPYIVYPEDVIPFLSDDEEGFDGEYWDEIRGLADFWYQMTGE